MHLMTWPPVKVAFPLFPYYRAATELLSHLYSHLLTSYTVISSIIAVQEQLR
jgi:hypothetical protein